MHSLLKLQDPTHALMEVLTLVLKLELVKEKLTAHMQLLPQFIGKVLGLTSGVELEVKLS